MSEVDYKIAIGEWVARRLERNPRALRIPCDSLDIFIVSCALDEADCARLVEMIDSDRVPSGLLSPSPDLEFRTSESCNLNPRDPAVERVEAKITAIMGIAPDQGETIQGQRYAVGQQFKGHHDFFYEEADYWPEMVRTGGQRTWTAMAFLNEPEGGGETFFEKAGVRVMPRPGNLLTWNNLDAAGAPNFFSMHQGMPVSAGFKYIITKWYRERRWVESDMPTY